MANKKDYTNVLNLISDAAAKKSRQREFIKHSRNAWKGTPRENFYKSKVAAVSNSLIKSSETDISNAGQRIKECLETIPDAVNMTVHNAIESIVSMVMGGIGRFDVGVDDSASTLSNRDLSDIGKALLFWQQQQKLDYRISDIARRISTDGVMYLHVGTNSKKPESSEDFKVTLMDANKVITDPTKWITNVERFIGWEQFESFEAVMLKAKAKNNKIKTLNNMKVYLESIKALINGVDIDTLGFDPDSPLVSDAISDKDIFYTDAYGFHYGTDDNARSYEQQKKADEDHKYSKDLVLVTYFYDYTTERKYTVVNRRFVIEDLPLYESTKVKCKYTYPKRVKNEDGTITIEEKTKEMTKTIRYGAPIVEIPYLTSPDYSFPTSDTFFILDEFSTLCSAESLLAHNLSIASPITFAATSSDAEKTSKLMSVSGEIVENTNTTTTVMNKQHDNSPVIGQIQRSEEKIKRTLGAPDQFELQQMVGDRATSREVVAASGAVSQRLNTLISRLEKGMSDLAELFIHMFLVHTDDKKNLTIEPGQYGEVDRDKLAFKLVISAKLRKSIELERTDEARRAIEILGIASPYIQYLNPEKFFPEMLTRAMNYAISKDEAEAMLINGGVTLPKQETPTDPFAIDFNSDSGNVDPALAAQYQQLLAQSQYAQDPNAQDPLTQDPNAPQVDPNTPQGYTGFTPESGGLVNNDTGL